MLPSHHFPIRFINKSNKNPDPELKMITNERKNIGRKRTKTKILNTK